MGEPRDDGPKVELDQNRLIVVAEDGAWFQYTWNPHIRSREPFPKAKSVCRGHGGVPKFQLIRPGKTVSVPGGTFVGDDDVLFEAPDPDRMLMQEWVGVVG